MPLINFSPSTTIKSADINANFAGLANGSLLNLTTNPSGFWDGWINANETWTFLSATTITVPAGGLLKYQVGDKIKLTQGTVKYWYIVAVTDTQITIDPNTDYTLTNTAITNNYYSHEASPVGHPIWMSYTPTYTGFSAAPNAACKFAIFGREVRFIHPSTNGTSNANAFTVSLPVTAANTGNRHFTCPQLSDNGATSGNPGLLKIAGAATTVTIFKQSDEGGTWTSSGAKGASFILIYDI